MRTCWDGSKFLKGYCICRGRSIQNMNAIMEMGCCIHRVVVFNGSFMLLS